MAHVAVHGAGEFVAYMGKELTGPEIANTITVRYKEYDKAKADQPASAGPAAPAKPAGNLNAVDAVAAKLGSLGSAAKGGK